MGPGLPGLPGLPGPLTWPVDFCPATDGGVENLGGTFMDGEMGTVLRRAPLVFDCIDVPGWFDGTVVALWIFFSPAGSFCELGSFWLSWAIVSAAAGAAASRSAARSIGARMRGVTCSLT